MTGTLLLYLITVLIWGSTWLGITFQLGVVDPLASVVYRFALAAALLVLFCICTRRSMRFSIGQHGFIFLQGACLFGLNYWLFYVAERYLTSGVVAVTFSTMVLWNTFIGHWMIGAPLRPQVLAGAALGFMGIGLVFWPELAVIDLSDTGFRGLLLSLMATLLASLGNILSARNQRSGLPVIQTNALGMTYGALTMLIVALALGIPFEFDPRPTYVISLLYLAIFGSIIAFGAYLTLLGKIGPDKAAYATLLFPIVALLLSTVWEDYAWTPAAMAGVTLIVGGNFIAQRPASRRRRPRHAIVHGVPGRPGGVHHSGAP
ncbi:MAG: DMT family transporter [Desulfosarcinaceae bacterium]|nr:DMT family transporter [Desulfosarcinaceae bacterium]